MIELTFQDAHFQDIKSGKKTTIGKIDADLQGIKKGETVVFFKDVGNKSNSSEKISVKVKDIKKFSDVSTMLKEMKLKTILPHSRTYKDGEKVCIIYDDGAVIVGSVNGKRLWGMELHVNLRLVEWSPGGQSILICTSKGQCLIFNSLGNPLSTIFLAASGGLPPVGIDWCKGNESHDENFQFPNGYHELLQIASGYFLERFFIW